MTMMIFDSRRGGYAARFSGGGGIGCLVFGILGLVAAYYILKGMFIVLYYASPVLFALALLINWRAVADTLKNWAKTLETNPVSALFTAALAVVAFPVFALYLFLKALGYNKMEDIRKAQESYGKPADGEFVEFEELESHPKGTVEDDEPIIRPDLPEKDTGQPRANPSQQPDNPYDQFFGK